MGSSEILTVGKTKVGGVCRFFLAQSCWSSTDLPREASCQAGRGAELSLESCLLSAAWRGKLAALDPAYALCVGWGWEEGLSCCLLSQNMDGGGGEVARGTGPSPVLPWLVSSIQFL